MLRPALLSLAALAVLAGCSNGEPPKPKVEPFAAASAALTDAVLLPAYTRWIDSDRQLADSARAFCAGEQDLAAARQAYLEAHRSWAALQPLAIGPLGEGNLAWQVQFWPDKKNLVARQVNALLDRTPQLRQADLEKASVVVQGLTAYEYLLFDPDIDLSDLEQKRRYCPLLVSIGSHQQALAAGVLAGWLGEQGLAAQLKSFPNARYAEGREAVAELLRAQVGALDGLKRKLNTPLPLGGKPPQPYQAEAWRSGASLELIDASLASAEAQWREGVRELLGKEQADLATRIDAAYSETRQRLKALGRPLGDLLGDEPGRTALVQLYDSLNGLHRLHEGELARALDIQLGFNAHDGD
ncbi:imelysin [Pseudomonas stutzeri]|nr:imelysin [Stutzerimonas stutzeri]